MRTFGPDGGARRSPRSMMRVAPEIRGRWCACRGRQPDRPRRCRQAVPGRRCGGNGAGRGGPPRGRGVLRRDPRSSGSGKTTLLNMIGLLDTPSEDGMARGRTHRIAGTHAAAPPHGELRVPELQLVPRPDRRRERAVRRRRRRACRSRPGGGRGARRGGPQGKVGPLPAPALGRGAAARRSRGAGHRQPRPAGRRAHRRAGLPHRRADPSSYAPRRTRARRSWS